MTAVQAGDGQKIPLIIVISGPSGVGKDAVVQGLKERDVPFHFVVTANTRPIRENETHGVDYLFVSKQEFERMIADDELFEYANVYSDYKGVPKSQVIPALESGKDVVMRLDVQGAETIKKKLPQSILVFINVSSEAELEKRLRERGTDSEEEIQLRLKKYRQELDYLDVFDYEVRNQTGKLDQAVDEVLAIIKREHQQPA